MTTPPFQNPWEKRLHEELRNLPELEAPAGLIPSVMAAISKQASLAWYQRPAMTWPAPLRIALVVLSVCLFGLLFLGLQFFMTGSPETHFFNTIIAKGETIVRALQAVVGAFLTVMRQYASPVMFGAIAAAALAYFTLLGLGGALWRVAAHHRVSR
jgi:hypothetical protein